MVSNSNRPVQPVKTSRASKRGFQPSARGVIAAALLLLALCAPANAASIALKGSDTLVILAQKWAETYMKLHPETQVQVTGGGSGTGFAALQNQTTDLAMASRPIKLKEVIACVKAFDQRPTEYKVALDGLCVYVHQSNPINELNLDQLKAVFTGKITNWKDLGGADAPIIPYSRENSSGTYEFFKEHVLKNRDFAANVQPLPGTAALVQAVAKDKLGIGYGGAAYGSTIKNLKVSKGPGLPAYEPNEQNILDGNYPISRYLYFYVNPALDKGDAAKFLVWIRGDEGQKFVQELGYYPLPAKMRSGGAPETSAKKE